MRTWIKQDEQDSKVKHEQVTRSMIRCVLEVINERGAGRAG